MALTYEQISAITQRKFIPKLHDNIFDSNPLLRRMKERNYVGLDGGLSIMVPLNYATTTASGWFSGSEVLSTNDNENITSAEYQWKNLYANVTIVGEDERKNSGDQAILRLVAEKVKIAEMTMRDTLGTGLYSDGTDADSIVGLRDIVATDQTVGGISQSSYSWWQGQVDSTTTTLSISAMQTQYNNASIDNETPSMITCTRSIFDSYYALLQPQQRFVDENTAKGGFTSLMFNGAPVVSDSHCPANHMFFINENHLKLYYHNQANFKAEPFMKPVNQDVKTMKIYWMGALGSSNNRLHAKLSGITG